MKKSIKVLLATIIFFVFFYNLSIGINIERTKSVNLLGISLAMAEDETKKCDPESTAFCKNNPPMNTGVCVTREPAGVCCDFTIQGNKDCYDATH
jgi:hypothetical protein